MRRLKGATLVFLPFSDEEGREEGKRGAREMQ
jgi:hypothetical protein